jgi:hypothetical protein
MSSFLGLFAAASRLLGQLQNRQDEVTHKFLI